MGVYYRKKRKRYEVSFSIQGKNVYLGCFETKEEAEKENNKFLRENFEKKLLELRIDSDDIKETNIEGYYVSKKGHILNKFGEELLGAIDKCGYREVSIKGKTLLSHRLILLTFNYNQDYRVLDVNHIDGNKTNNNLENLEWCTRSENVIHSFKNGLQDNVTNKYGNKKIIPISEFVKLKEKEMTVKEISKKLNCCEKTVRNKLNGKRNV